MRSKASIKGHPIHPALIPFPMAFLFGAFGFDVAGRVAGRQEWWTTGSQLAIAGIVMALVAAIPGLIDYFRTVPPKSSGKRRATLHMTANLTVVGLFLIATMVRADAGAASPPGGLTLGLEGLAVALLAVGGWLGGTLAFRNEIGVVVRYARAGKWSETSIDAMPGERVRVASIDELQPDQMKLLHVRGRRVVLARTEQGYVVFDDHCTHRGGSLAGGTMICGTVQCPWHGSQFDARTGAVRAGPARTPVAAYRVEESGGQVFLLVDKHWDAGPTGRRGEGTTPRRLGGEGRDRQVRRRPDKVTNRKEES
jgi:nitrite reductase/ring-hydroxylating ferredoxin subunit/uncharacterized membrane protein